MMRRRLAARDILGARQKLHFFARRDMQHMHLRARLARKADEPFGRAQSRDLVAPDRMRGRIARDPHGLALIQARLVFAMEGRAAPRLSQDRKNALVIRDQQAPGRGAHEHLDPRRALEPFEFGDVGDIVMRAADPEGEVAMHAALRPRQLVGERFRAHGQRVGVGHFEHRGHASEHGRARAGLQILFMNETRLAKMHLGVDDARKNMQAAAIDALARRRAAESADLGDPPVKDANVALTDPVLVDHSPIDQDTIETRRHGCSFLRGRESGLFDSLRPCKPNRRRPCTRKPPCSRIAALFA